jgi:hypothetical protein
MRNEAPPTARQVYALAAALCEQADEEFPSDRAAASVLIERLRLELGHPEPRLIDRPASRRPSPGMGGTGMGGTSKFARAVAAEVVRELR